jgi:hypothetical protein
LEVLTAIGACDGLFILGQWSSVAYPPTHMSAAMTVVLNARPVIAAIAAGTVLIRTLTSVMGPETQAKPPPGALGLHQSPSHTYIFAAE